jgi:hypothetical protein
LESPEFYVIQGYDNTGYWYSGPGSVEGKGPRPWKEVGLSEIGILEMYSIRLCDQASPREVLIQAFEKVLYMTKNPEDIVFKRNRAGISGYDLWIAEVEEGTAQPFGMAYNAAVWSECRTQAVAFLEEAQKKLPKDWRQLLENARVFYKGVAEALDSLAKLYPFSQPMHEKCIGIDARSKQAASLLRQARDAESKGLEGLRLIHNQLSKTKNPA